jgi:hypothetical protein
MWHSLDFRCGAGGLRGLTCLRKAPGGLHGGFSNSCGSSRLVAALRLRLCQRSFYKPPDRLGLCWKIGFGAPEPLDGGPLLVLKYDVY